MVNINFLKKKIIYLFLKREGGRNKGRYKHQCVVASQAPPPRDLAHNPGMCPDWELNRWPFGSQASTQSTEPHQPGQNINVLKEILDKSNIQIFDFSHGLQWQILMRRVLLNIKMQKK